jgi:hypothetical protein
LSWDKITPADYKEWSHSPDASYLAGQSLKRTSNDSVFNLVREEAQSFKNDRDSTLYSLVLEVYRKHEKAQTDETKRFAAINKPLPFEKVSLLLNQPSSSMDANHNNEKDTLLALDNVIGSSKHEIAGENESYSVLISATTTEKDKMRADTNEAKSEKNWLQRLTKDPELFEATRVIGDMK